MNLQFSISPDKKENDRYVGDVYATEFSFTKTTLPSYINLTWDFGDGNYAYNEPKVSHTYNYPGIYTVSLSAWSPLGELVTTYDFVDVDYVYRDAIRITNLPKTWSVPGVYSDEPFYVSLTSAKIDQPLSIVLHSLNSKSQPHDASDSKWNFLNPRWRFINAQTGNIVTGPVQLSSVPLYKNGTVVAVSSIAAFYYIDDSPTITETPACPVIVMATLSTENFSYPPESLIYPYYSYSNNEMVQSMVIWETKNVVPTTLKVTENFLNEVYSVKWTGIPIPVMINCTFDPTFLTTFEYISGAYESNVFAYPKTNEIGSLRSVDIKLHGYSPDEYTVDTSLYFQHSDANGNPIGGYIFTTITPLISSKNLTTFVTASTVAVNNVTKLNEFPFPNSYPIEPVAFVSHPYENNINKIQLASYDPDCPSAKRYKAAGFLADGFINCISVPPLETTNTDNLEVSGTSNIYGLSYNPITQTLYGADADKNTICAINSKEQITTTVYISATTHNQYDTPSYVSIDSDHNVWVSLHDSSLILKYDQTLQTVLASATPVLNAFNILDDEGEPIFETSLVETDRNNNVWACYSHPVSSLIVKYDSMGMQLTSYNLGYNSLPVSTTIDKQNSLWVACLNANQVKCFSSAGMLLSSYEFLKPSYVAVDRKNNVWVLHGNNVCSTINTQTAKVSSWEIDTSIKRKFLISTEHIKLSSYSDLEIYKVKSENEIWGGLAVDVFDRVWMIDSQYNNIGVFPTYTHTPESFNVFGVAPRVSKNFAIKTGTNYTTKITSSVARSAQAAGDWTGNRWYQKYATKYFTTTISGSSNEFKVNNLDNVFSIIKVNDDFNCGAYLKSLALPEILSQNTLLWDSFLPSVVGSGDVTKQDLGRTTYEKIANFTTNHSDVDTVGITQLHSLADQLDVGSKRFGADFPAEIQESLGLFSIPRKNLFGTKVYDPDVANTIGTIITLTENISAGEYLYAKDRKYDTYQLIYATRETNQNSTYALSAINVDGLREPIHDNYYFFRYNESYIGYSSSVIDWTSKYNSIDREKAMERDWYSSDEIVELYFNNLLTKRLFGK
jgi:hypothetical protein